MPETKQGHACDVQGNPPSIESMAKLCAVGAVPIPDDLQEPQQRKLLTAIAEHRRKRLLHLFAAAIADEIWREQQKDVEVKNAKSQI